MAEHRVVSHSEWLEARKKLLVDEKEATRARDRLSQARRDLPWERVDKEYVFEGPKGRATLEDAFDGRSQLVIYHTMFNPETAGPQTSWTADAACFVCTWWMDNFDRIVIHLNHHDVTMAAVSLAPYETLAAYHKRMGWSFPWYSSVGSDFNFDYRVSFTPKELAAGKADYNYRTDPVGSFSEAPGVSVFLRDGGKIYHTYSTYARGLDILNVAYQYLDITPKGRNEQDQDVMWVHRRDEYPD
ncbi:MAG TPA: DUF899 family protein [Candidatus Dormibacteraeota bacterium]|nr:DUF899 family protein [Candidatus Dormibacteraeota bacterium]